MKPIRSTIPIKELQTLLRQWRRRGLREAALLKVLELYLGLPDYMNEQGEYPVHFFYELSVSLKFRTVTLMLEAVRLSDSFGWIGGDNRLNVSAIFSPLWKAVDAKKSDSTDDFPAEMHVNRQVDNVYNINNYNTPLPLSRGENPSTQHAAFLLNPSGGSLTQHAASLLDPSEEGRMFFHEVNANPAEKAEVLQPLITFFQQQEPGLPREEACADVVHLVNELLIPHFTTQERFLRMKHNGRLAWLKNLLKSAHGKELLKKAAEAGKLRRLQQRQQALAEVKQNNRPLSPHEWTDPVSGTRFYEDAVEGTVTIPKEAPPRPSEDAFWNVIQRRWIP